jgi:hypothetical protein
MTQGQSKMSDISKTLFSAAASLATLILISSAANAQRAAFTGIDGEVDYNFVVDAPITATYNFSKSMIVNSIGMADTGRPNSYLAWAINNGSFTTIDPNYSSGNIRWYDFSEGLSLQQGDELKVRTVIVSTPFNIAYEYHYDSFDLAPDVTFGGTTNSATGFTNSSIKVSPSNPGSNVAPEPGSFALALTGGAALIGICIRRRRNAA